MHFRSPKWNRQLARKATALLVLVLLLLSLVPIPVASISQPSKDLSQPFPCQSRSCGCRTAEQCWTGCCCHTPAQRREWAKKNNVTPPDYAVLADDASIEGLSLSVDPSTTAFSTTPSCCSKTSASSRVDKACNNLKSGDCDNAECRTDTCQAQLPASTQKSCCSTKKKSATRSDIEDSSGDFVLLIQALKCRGLSPDFGNLPWAITWDEEPSSAEQSPLVYSFIYADDQSLVVYSPVDTPPPRPFA